MTISPRWSREGADRPVLVINPLAVSPATAAAMTETSESTINRLIADKEIPTVFLRGKRRVPVAALARWIEEQTER